MKHLKIIYNDVVLWDGPVGELSWQESDNGVKVEGRIKSAPKGGGAGGGLLDMLTGMSKASTANKANQLREAAETEAVEAAVEEEPVEVS